jgi:hypothetical protein
MSEFKDIFGAPGTGVHSHRTFGLATVDLFGTVAIAAGISWYYDYSFLLVLVILLVLGIILHYLFRVDTAFNVLLFGRHSNLSGNHLKS